MHRSSRRGGWKERWHSRLESGMMNNIWSGGYNLLNAPYLLTLKLNAENCTRTIKITSVMKTAFLIERKENTTCKTHWHFCGLELSNSHQRVTGVTESKTRGLWGLPEIGRDRIAGKENCKGCVNAWTPCKESVCETSHAEVMRSMQPTSEGSRLY